MVAELALPQSTSAHPTSAWTGGTRLKEGAHYSIYDLYSPAAVGNLDTNGTFFQHRWAGVDMSTRDGTVLAVPNNSSFFLRCPTESISLRSLDRYRTGLPYL